MSDRCYLWYYCNIQDLKKISQFDNMDLQPDEITFDKRFPSKVLCQIYESNYSSFEARHQVARNGLIFWGGYDAGDEYGANWFLTIDGKLLEIPTWEGSPCLVLNNDGSIDRKGLLRTKKYFEKIGLVKLHVLGGVIP